MLAGTLLKICQNKSFLLPVFCRLGTESVILSLYEKCESEKTRILAYFKQWQVYNYFIFLLFFVFMDGFFLFNLTFALVGLVFFVSFSYSIAVAHLIICGEVSKSSILGPLIDKSIILFHVFSASHVQRSVFCKFVQENHCSQAAVLPLRVIITVSNNAIPLMSSEFS